MELEKFLKQLKNIEPDKGFSIKSRSFILMQQQNPQPVKAPRFTMWNFARTNIEFGASLAFMVLLIYVMLGGFANLKWSAPLEVANLDPASLKAEAQAIDLQIQLTNLNYQAGGFERSLRLSESTTSSTITSLSTGIKSAASGTLGIDETLDKLSQ